MSEADWKEAFRAVYDRGVAAWKAGRRSAKSMFSPEDVRFLASIGCTAQELFDFVDDTQQYGEPDYETTLAVQAVRRDYFLNTLQGKSSGRVASMDELPPKPAAAGGIPWLPRAIAKARLKLRGEMPDELMYCCGGDRDFFERVNMPAAEFLKLVRDAGNDDQRIIEAVKKSAGRR